MDMSFLPEELAFRDEVRSFIADNQPPGHDPRRPRSEMSREENIAWHKILYKKGWVAPGWPVEYGGTGWTLTQRYIWNEEVARAEMPVLVPFGLAMVGPVIYTFGNQKQKDYFLPRILSGEHWWCQGYSEPGAGSDLASVATKAVREGDHYIVNGTKTWTTLAQYADWIFCLVRTDPDAKPQAGISFLLIDMKSPGITVRPIITLDKAHEVNEVFFDNVKVPVENLIGEENKGWTYAKFLLGHERNNIAGVARSKNAIARLKQIARAELVDGGPLIETPDFAAKIAAIEIDIMALEVTELRALAAQRDKTDHGASASLLKVRGTEIAQAINELVLEAVGHYAFVEATGGEFHGNQYVPGPEYSVGASLNYFGWRKSLIYGGSNEIQRNIMAKMVLGL